MKWPFLFSKDISFCSLYFKQHSLDVFRILTPDLRSLDSEIIASSADGISINFSVPITVSILSLDNTTETFKSI
eukprot:snap_masked-scaffold_41-processed-gene-2.72-mRNA-1 protein AED:1.00 eAED:1.00 QI:0/0/0/0/1/1/3/0/73